MLFLTVTGVFVVCWAPFVIQGFLMYTSHSHHDFYRGFLRLALLNCGLNFFIYAWKNKDFKAAYKRLLLDSCKSEHEVCWMFPNPKKQGFHKTRCSRAVVTSNMKSIEFVIRKDYRALQRGYVGGKAVAAGKYADSYSVSVPPPCLAQWQVKDPLHSAESANGRLHLYMHTTLTQRSRSGLTMPLSRHSVWIIWKSIGFTTGVRW